MERISELHSVPRQLSVANVAIKAKPALSKEDIRKSDTRVWLELNSSAPAEVRRGKKFLQKHDEVVPSIVLFKICSDSFEEVGSTSFHGVSHPREPVDTDLMRTVYVPISPNSGDGKCLVGSLSILSPAERLIEKRNDSVVVSSPFSAPQALTDSDNKERAHSSIENIGVAPAMSTVNSFTNTHHGDGSHIVDRNDKCSKGRIPMDSVESTKSSLSRGSDSSGISDESNCSNLITSVNKPHKGNDPRWKAILTVRCRDGTVGMSHFRLLKRLGCGDIGSVYLSELSMTRCFFAMKVMDKASLSCRRKLVRAQTEREVLQLLDHPFLPTLYTHFETDRFSCLVMEYCPGGDLHILRQRQPGKHFSEHAVRFYAAEVLLALEYLHMLGVVYRDLKPENVLVRDDGHIMLSDFDLSLKCPVLPTLVRTSGFDSDNTKHGAAFCVQPACIEPASTCIQTSCFFPRFLPQKGKRKSGKHRGDPGMSSTLPELVAEPTAARSMSFVGTHEYLAPEIIKGEGHGSAVDWWTFGIFLYELLYGRTPFKGSGNRATLFNVVGQQLKFPSSPATSYASRDLIRGLLVKEPQNRLGVKRGAAEIKQHPFFEGINWALVRCSTPPEIPRPVEDSLHLKYDQKIEPVGANAGNKTTAEVMKPGGNYLDLEFF